MKNILRGLCCVGLLVVLGSLAPAASLTMTGIITDDCDAASRAKIIAAHKDTKMTARDLSLACVQNGGKYVFVADGRVFQIANRSQAELAKQAGAEVRLTGDVEGSMISVSTAAIFTVYYTRDGSLGGGGDAVCQEYYGPRASDVTAEHNGDGGTVCAVSSTRARTAQRPSKPGRSRSPADAQ